MAQGDLKEWQTIDNNLDKGKWEPKEPAQSFGPEGIWIQSLSTHQLASS